MPDPSLTFILPPQLTAEKLKSRLGNVLAVQTESPVALERLYYDTFDWRLFRAGLALAQDCRDVSAAAWRLYELDHGDTVAALDMPSPTPFDCHTHAPFLAAALPEGPLSAALEPLTTIRALLPLVHISGTTTTLRFLNKDIKTVLRLAIDETRLVSMDGQGEKVPLPAVARLLPVRGYDRPLQTVSALLADMDDLQPVTGDPMTIATTAAGRPPGDYSSSLRIPLTPTDRADDAARAIYRTLFETILVNEPGLRADIDIEFLHDYRVAVRRTRSALSQIKDVLPGQKLEHFKAEFGWLGQVTGPTRDLDVYLQQFDDFRSRLPEPMRDRLDPLRAHLESRQREEQAILVRALSSARYRKLKRQWLAFLDKAAPQRRPPVNAALPILALANRQIWRAYRRVALEARAVTSASPAEEVHEVRKSAKKLRYLMEFYATLYPALDFKALVIELKQLQDVLGEYQDLQVQIDSLERYAAEMQAAGEVPAATLMAIGALTGQLYSRELEVREELMPYLERFARPKLRGRFADLFDRPLDGVDGKEATSENEPHDQAMEDNRA